MIGLALLLSPFYPARPNLLGPFGSHQARCWPCPPVATATRTPSCLTPSIFLLRPVSTNRVPLPPFPAPHGGDHDSPPTDEVEIAGCDEEGGEAPRSRGRYLSGSITSPLVLGSSADSFRSASPWFGRRRLSEQRPCRVYSARCLGSPSSRARPPRWPRSTSSTR